VSLMGRGGHREGVARWRRLKQNEDSEIRKKPSILGGLQSGRCWRGRNIIKTTSLHSRRVLGGILLKAWGGVGNYDGTKGETLVGHSWKSWFF